MLQRDSKHHKNQQLPFMKNFDTVLKTSRFNGWQASGRLLKTVEIAKDQPDYALFVCLIEKGDEFEPLGRGSSQHSSELLSFDVWINELMEVTSYFFENVAKMLHSLN